MKRPPGLWILLSAGVLWLSLQDVYGIRATALIFGKSSTSTTTEAVSSSEATNGVETVNSTEATTTNSTSSSSNSSEPTLTGNPQLDYIYDPNLPKELNGYNLSEYPFYERVPAEEIDFKCDGLHDGFYASVPHKCQVYHHCLFGTRYDFLCANYTAFDQKTFICQFVSEVDCQNSKKFWHRNDALYTAQSTTTSAPVNLKAAIYTTAPPDAAPANPITPLAPRRPPGARRPYRPGRRRPPVEYYDDEYYDDEEYYDERPRLRRKRPRRPVRVYDDDYEEYEDERYESRRRPYRNRRRNKGRRKPEYEDEEVADDRAKDEEVQAPKRPKNEERRKNPPDDEEPAEDRNRKRPSDRKKNNRRPVQDYEEDEIPESDDSHTFEQRPRKKQNNEGPVSDDGRPIIKPATGTIYDRPRVAPRINLPVPKNAADKYAYKAIGSAKSATTTTTTTTTTPPVKEEQEYEDEEYEEPVPAKRRPSATVRNRRPEVKKNKSEESRSPSNVSRSRTRKPEETEETTKTPTKPRFETLRNRYRANMKKPAVVEEEYDDADYLEETVKKEQLASKNDRRTSTTTTTTTSSPTTTTTSTTTTSEAPVRKEPVMRIIKRPFLPSRGGSPYNGRGLQPIGLKAADKAVLENDSQESRVEEQDYVDEEQSKELEPIRELSRTDDRPKPVFKPSPVIVKVPVRSKYTPELISPESSRLQTYKSSYTTPKNLKDPLDLNEYDVTLNEALSPTLPNLPIRAFPTGFGSAGDYGYAAYSRPRYVLEPVLSPTNHNYVNANKRSQQRYEAVPHQVQYTEASRGYRHQQQHGQTQAILSGY